MKFIEDALCFIAIGFFSRFLFDLLGGIAAVIQRHRGNFAKRKT